ncbi:MAG: response regulator [Polyangiaceae bacterium]
MRVSSPRRSRVLIVDDEALIGRVVARALGPFAEVEVAVSGSEALDKIKEGQTCGARFDLVVCDVMMPEMSGPELFALVKELDPPTAGAFVFVTGGASEDQLSLLSATGVPCLHKPLDVDTIRTLLPG